ncbi:MAG: hypothetical protein MJ072_03720, partial [Clostridia bacterium]|nr:hypothetical protein [Clostridia bacterium]
VVLLDNGNDLQRQTRTLISAKDPDRVAETLKNFDLVRNGKPEERKAFLDMKLKSLIDLTNDLQGVKTDAEFMKAVNGRYGELLVLTEVQPDSMARIIEDFGVEPDPAIYEQWKNMHEQMLDCGKLADRISLITSPEYQEISIEDATNVNEYISGFMPQGREQRSDLIDLLKDSGWKGTSAIDGDVEKMREDGEVEINTFADMYSSVAICKPDYIRDKIVTQLNTVAKTEYGLDKDDVKFKELNGNELFVKDASRRQL